MLNGRLIAAMVGRACFIAKRLEAGDQDDYAKQELERIVWRLKQYRADGTPIRVDDPPGPSAWDLREEIGRSP